MVVSSFLCCPVELFFSHVLLKPMRLYLFLGIVCPIPVGGAVVWFFAAGWASTMTLILILFTAGFSLWLVHTSGTLAHFQTSLLSLSVCFPQRRPPYTADRTAQLIADGCKPHHLPAPSISHFFHVLWTDLMPLNTFTHAYGVCNPHLWPHTRKRPSSYLCSLI